MRNIKYEKLTLTLNPEGTEYSVSKCEKDAVEVAIPAFIDGIPVVSVGDFAFENCDKLISVTFPEHEDILGVIGDNAFYRCEALASVVVPEYIYRIGHGAFGYCSSLVSAEFSYGTEICDYAFTDCVSLTKVTPISSYIGEGVFCSCEKLAVFPVGCDVEEIGDYAFRGCLSLVNITIPSSVERIGALAFRSCRGLARVAMSGRWYERTKYTGDRPIDVSDSARCADILSEMDFDDGVLEFYRE